MDEGCGLKYLGYWQFIGRHDFSSDVVDVLVDNILIPGGFGGNVKDQKEPREVFYKPELISKGLNRSVVVFTRSQVCGEGIDCWLEVEDEVRLRTSHCYIITFPPPLSRALVRLSSSFYTERF